MVRYLKIFLLLFNVHVFIISVAQNKKLPFVQTPVFKGDTFNIIKYGAIADGLTTNTLSINQAIIACNRKGGGTVLIPGGTWLTGPIELKSNVNLYLERNSLLQFTKDFSEYPLVKGNWEGVEQMRNQSPISATGQSNIGITGFGIIDGNGDAWRMVKKEKLSETQWNKLVASGGVLNDEMKTWFPSTGSMKGASIKDPGVITPVKNDQFYNSVKDFLRPNLLVLNNCRIILLEGVTFQNSPAWNLHPLMCEYLTIRDVVVKNPWYAQNGDGIDIESCKNILIENSVFDVGDDGICIKSGKDSAGRKRGIPTENVMVKNCTVYHAHGGFVIGSEMSGGASNLYVEKCSFIGTDIGLRFKTVRGRGGVVENVFISDINMKDIVGEAILFDMYYSAVDPVEMTGEKRKQPKIMMLPVNDGTPQFRNFYIKNITCNGAAKAFFIRGLPEMHIKNISFQNITIQSLKGMEINEASNISFKNINVMPMKSDPVIGILNSDSISFDKLSYPTSVNLLFKIAGEKTNSISVTNTNIYNAKQKVQFELNAKENSLNFK